jgi:pimeloyl-ACP methyl ester carboxylesterase
MNLPGHGGNSRPGGVLVAVDQLTELAGLRGAVDLVGFSAGAQVCALAAAAGQVAVRRLVLAGLGDTALRAGGEPADDAGSGLTGLSLTGPLDDGDVRSRLFRRMAASAGNDPQALEAFRAAPAGELTAGVLARIACPTLVIIGERDHLGPATQVAGSVPGAQLITLPRTDHFATPSHVEAILAALRFLAA